jgi:hypothetical protein
LFHHDPDHSDRCLDAVHGAVQQRIAALGVPLVCDVAREGQLIVV